MTTKATASPSTMSVAKSCIPSVDSSASNVPCATHARTSSGHTRALRETRVRPIAYPQMAPKNMCAGTVSTLRIAMTAPDIRPKAKYLMFSTAAKPSADAHPYTMPSTGSSNSRRCRASDQAPRNLQPSSAPPTTRDDTAIDSGSAQSCPPMVTSDVSSHGESLAHPASINAAGTIDRPPSAKVASTSHIGSGRPRSKRRTNSSHASDSTNGSTAEVMARPHRGGSTPADRRCSGGSTGERSRSLERYARV